MDSPNFWKVCRFCLSENRLRPLFDRENDIRIKITTCAPVRVCEEDDLPDFICETCEFKICSFYEFKKQCEASELELKTKLKRTNSAGEDDVFEDAPDVSIHRDRKRYTLKRGKGDGVRIRVKKFVEKNEEAPPESKLWHKPENVAVSDRTGGKRFQCELCGEVFGWMSVLNKHLTTHSPDGARFGCPSCPKRFTRKEYVAVHMRTHEGVRPFVCEICARSFVRRQDLIRHATIHDDERNFACPECGKRFKRSADVHCHERTHTGAVPFSCGRCLKGYKSRTGMMKHYRKNQCGVSNRHKSDMNG